MEVMTIREDALKALKLIAIPVHYTFLVGIMDVEYDDKQVLDAVRAMSKRGIIARVRPGVYSCLAGQYR